MHICMRDIRNDGVAHDWGGVIHSAAVLYYADMLCYSPQAQRSMPRTRSWALSVGRLEGGAAPYHAFK